jgi:hypothetical protein
VLLKNENGPPGFEWAVDLKSLLPFRRRHSYRFR